jgi:hypothetical protein
MDSFFRPEAAKHIPRVAWMRQILGGNQLFGGRMTPSGVLLNEFVHRFLHVFDLL